MLNPPWEWIDHEGMKCLVYGQVVKGFAEPVKGGVFKTEAGAMRQIEHAYGLDEEKGQTDGE